VKREHGLDFSQTLEQMTGHIERSGDPSAAALFARFKEELKKGQLDRSTLRKVWEDIEKILPSIATLESSGNMKALIS